MFAVGTLKGITPSIKKEGFKTEVIREYHITETAILISINDCLHDGYIIFKGYTLEEAKQEYYASKVSDKVTSVIFKEV